MQTSERPEFVRVLNGLALMKPGSTKLTPEALDLWWAGMRAWELSEFKAAATHLASSVEFMPSPFHFQQLRKAAELTPGEAWAAVLKLCLDWRYQQPDSRVLRAAQAVGGLRAIAHCNTERDLPFLETRFKQAFTDLAEVEVTRAALPHLAARESEGIHAIKQRIASEKPRALKSNGEENVIDSSALDSTSPSTFARVGFNAPRETLKTKALASEASS